MRFRNTRLLPLLAAALLLTPSCRHPDTSPAAYNARIGIAVKLADRICMAIRNPKLLPAATITLISPADVTKDALVYSARAQILSRGVDACPGTRADATLANYSLVITTGSPQPNLPLIALDARVPSVLAAHSFHACQSTAGIQLTAWDGAKPLEGHRLWHQYYDLGEKLNATCTAAETADY